jgi:hypothetical protein
LPDEAATLHYKVKSETQLFLKSLDALEQETVHEKVLNKVKFLIKQNLIEDAWALIQVI